MAMRTVSTRNPLPPRPPKTVAKLGSSGGPRFAPIPPSSSVKLCSSRSSRSSSNGESSKLYSSSSPSMVCNSRMSFDNESTADSFAFSEEDDEDYIDCSILEAVEVKSGPEGFLIKMRDGCYVKCEHNKLLADSSSAAAVAAAGGAAMARPQQQQLPEYAPQPAIVLQTNDGSNLLLPIIVLELPCTMLLEAVRELHVARPTVYQVMRDMLQLLGYRATLVRVTKRVQEAYYARVYLIKDDVAAAETSSSSGDETSEAQGEAQAPTAATVSLDLRPSDAINLAVRCQIPIQVNRELAVGDGVRIVSELERLPSSRGTLMRSSAAASLTDFDRPETGRACEEALEFDLVRSMLIAAVEERYVDAAKLRDELAELRSKNRKQTQT